jgi:hypothetical protein
MRRGRIRGQGHWAGFFPPSVGRRTPWPFTVIESHTFHLPQKAKKPPQLPFTQPAPWTPWHNGHLLPLSIQRAAPYAGRDFFFSRRPQFSVPVFGEVGHSYCLFPGWTWSWSAVRSTPAQSKSGAFVHRLLCGQGLDTGVVSAFQTSAKAALPRRLLPAGSSARGLRGLLWAAWTSEGGEVSSSTTCPESTSWGRCPW